MYMQVAQEWDQQAFTLDSLSHSHTLFTLVKLAIWSMQDLYIWLLVTG